MTNKLVILGCGGNCFDIVDTVEDINRASGTSTYEVLGFLDDDPRKAEVTYRGIKVIGGLKRSQELSECVFVNGIGSPNNFRSKASIIESLGIPEDRFISLLHPSVSVSPSASLSCGVVAFQNCVITSNVRIGKHVIMLPNSVISHDCIVGDYCCITGGVNISGGVVIGASCYLGSNCAIIQNVTIGHNTMVGIGSTVIGNVPADSVVVGNPARDIRTSR